MNILVFRTGFLGDTIVSLPALRAIRQTFPKAHLILLYGDAGKQSLVSPRALLDGTGIIDEFMPYPLSGKWRKGARALWHRLCLLRTLRKKRISAVIHLEPSYKTPWQSKRDSIYFYLGGARQQIRTLPDRCSHAQVRPLPLHEHEADFFLRSLKSHGIGFEGSVSEALQIRCGAAEEREVQAWMAELNRGSTTARVDWPACAVAVAVGSKMQAKRWPVEYYVNVLKYLTDNHGVWPVFFGGCEDCAVSQSLIDTLGVGWNASGKLSLRGAIAALRKCSFYLGNDTGTMHMAVSAGIPCVAIFSARDYPGKWYPYGSGHRIHRIATDCEGCMLEECIERKRECLTRIDPADVYESCRAVMGRQGEFETLKR